VLSRCVSIDLEVDPKSNRIESFAAVHVDAAEPFVFRRGNLQDALNGLEGFADDADFLLGHNIIHFDIPMLEAARGSLKLLSKPAIDTLWLNPLAYPRNPYHHLVKHYKDGRLQAGHINDPVLDAELVLTVLKNQVSALRDFAKNDPDTLTAFHWLANNGSNGSGFDAVFVLVRDAPCPQPEEAREAIFRLLREQACMHQINVVMPGEDQDGWPLAYAISWISVSGGDSVMPPWVRKQFPEAGRLVRQLRDTPCADPGCSWCRSQNDPTDLLTKWFGFESFRTRPADRQGRPLQEAIVANALSKTPTLGILPTGTGKSVCYQLPALAQYNKTGALTVVISPLVALMSDQVSGLQRQGIAACVTINGMLSLPERQEALDQVRLGDAAILLISPEQLRSPSVRTILDQREIGYWVLDEAHCISKWGHDFRPDYRYVARFIKEYSGEDEPAPLLCLTATAKPGVIRDIVEHFHSRLGMELQLIDGGAVRENLSFEIVPTNKAQKLGDIVAVLDDALPKEDICGGIVYCSTRSATERVAGFLREKGFAAAHYHAGLKAEARRDVQQQFSNGALRVIAATNAFGMGIDKPDIRVVIHGDIPGSLENYVQEAGRAGRDRSPARCILLFSNDDIERQFSLSARSRLNKREIAAILKALRRLDRRTKRNGEVAATPGEIVKEELDHQFERDTATDDTRVKTAIAWLEESVLLKREENRVRVYPSSLKVRTVEQAMSILGSAQITDGYRNNLAALVRSMIDAPPDQGITTDELCGQTGLSPARLRKALTDLEALGVASNDTALTVFLHIGIERSSEKRLAEVAELEASLIGMLRELAPDLEPGGESPLNLKIASQQLRDDGHSSVRPHILESLIRGIARDGRDEEEGIGSLRVRKIDREHLSLRLQRSWNNMARTAELRRKGAAIVLSSLLDSAPAGARGTDIQVETTLGNLTSAISNDLELSREITEPSKLLDRALLWGHEQGVYTLGKGITIFRPAITIHLDPGTRQFTKADFEPLRLHYDEQTLQTHIMAAYAEIGLESMPRALRLSEDYFTLNRGDFIDRWLPGRAASLRRQTTPDSWRSIVESLGDPNQSRIVSDDREQTNVLVLAGPGSGKTRVLVHRIAYLIRIKRENPRGILALVYNRHAATEIRQRLFDLLGDDARAVTISTCHGLAMRLIGASFSRNADNLETEAFDKILQQAVSLLRGDGLSRDEADAQRETLIEGFRWIFVDEYQDIGPDEYELIAAVAGRSLDDEDSRLSLFAVGDDDQNIYAFTGASVEFIRRFEDDYRAQPVHLVENYRSTANIINVSNLVIARAAERMKAGRDIVVNTSRKRQAPGGALEKLDTVSRGRVQIVHSGSGDFEQAIVAVSELERLETIDPDWSWTNAAVIARNWRYLQPVRSYCEARGIPVQTANASLLNIWRLREMQTLIDWLRNKKSMVVHARDLTDWMGGKPDGVWWSAIRQGVEEFVGELGDRETDRNDVIEWFAEWGRDLRRRQTGLLLLSAHRAKGLEFDDVVILDGGWDRQSREEDTDAARRLYYVAMTRARRSLALVSQSDRHPFTSILDDPAILLRSRNPNRPDTKECRKIYLTLDPSEVDLSFAGRLGDANDTLAAIKHLNAGDPVTLVKAQDRWFIVDGNGVRVSRLARKFKPPANTRFVEGRAAAIMTRFRTDSAEEYQSALKRDAWHIVLPELVFQPDQTPPSAE